MIINTGSRTDIPAYFSSWFYRRIKEGYVIVNFPLAEYPMIYIPVKEVGEYRYKLKNNEGKYKSITLKEIYKRLFNKVFCKDNIELLDNEVFKEIKDSCGNYEVSNLGRIKSKVGNHAIILKPYITKCGYERLQLYIEGKRYNKYVHSLVASTWLDPPQSLEYEIHHKDFNSLNNNVSNLEYLSRIQHYKKHEERKKNVKNKKKKNNN